MKRHKHLWSSFCTWDNFSIAANRMLKGKRMTREGARFSARWEDEVCRLLHELESGNYRPGPYHYFTIHEPKERIVAAGKRGQAAIFSVLHAPFFCYMNGYAENVTSRIPRCALSCDVSW